MGLIYSKNSAMWEVKTKVAPTEDMPPVAGLTQAPSRVVKMNRNYRITYWATTTCNETT